ncbi:hypothetical protein Q8W14_08545 [Photobacterium damselae subsp. piscicida]|nr:hypothetical protein [Photobacterium damselae subsp. piscicida]MDP2568454.1 hypothetical protein [Photobacterium damselae subsp. piscicida]
MGSLPNIELKTVVYQNTLTHFYYVLVVASMSQVNGYLLFFRSVPILMLWQ